MRCPYCGSLDTQVKELADRRKFRGHSPTPGLSELQRTLHDV